VRCAVPRNSLIHFIELPIHFPGSAIHFPGSIHCIGFIQATENPGYWTIDPTNWIFKELNISGWG